MKALKCNASGDVDVTGGLTSFVLNADAVYQKIVQRLKMFQGEWFVDTRLGLPYRRHVFVKNPDWQLLRSLFRRAVAETDGVLSCETLELTFDASARSLQVDFKATLETREVLDTRNGRKPFILET